nr:MAG TPA: portal protein [Caudoviricetes sp.]
MKRLERRYTNGVDEVSIKQINEFLTGLKTSAGGDNLSEVTYLTCLKTLYETVGKLNFDVLQDTDKGTRRVFDHELVPVLRQRPNPHLTPSVFKQIMERNRNHYGNAYAYIERDARSGRLLSLTPLNPRNVRVLVDNESMLGHGSKIYYQFTSDHTGEMFLFDETDVLHVKFSLTDESGLVGRSVQEVLASTMEGAKAAQGFLNNLYQNGMTAAAVLEYVGDLDKKKIEELKRKLEESGTGAVNAGRIMPIPPGTKIVPLDLKLSDSQFFELKKYNALQIASVFGVKPSQINDYDKASYASSEAQNLSFYVDTLLAILKQYEEEIDHKLISSGDLARGIHVKANVSSILRADLKTQAEILASNVNNAIMTPNEARDKLDLMANEDGDILMANGNYIPLGQVGKQYGISEGGDEG